MSRNRHRCEVATVGILDYKPDKPKKLTMKPGSKSLVFATLLATATLSLNASDWPQYRGPELDGKSPEKLQLKQWPAGGPRTLWKVPMPNGFSSFSVADGKAFTIAGPDGPKGKSEVVVALDTNTGKILWRSTIGGADYGHDGGNAGAPDNKGGDGPRSTPTYDNGKLYTISADLVLMCLDANTGRGIWKQDLVADYGAENIKWKNAASAVIDGDLVFLAGGGKGQAFLAFHKDSGKLAWKGQDDIMTHSTPTVATIHGVRQVIFFSQTGLASLTTETGKLLWRYDFPFAVSTAISPVVAGDIVYCSAGYGVGAGAARITKSGDAFTAAEIYRNRGNKFLANHWSTPVYHDGYLYGMFQFKEYAGGPVKCVDVKTGGIKWEQGGFGPGNLIYVDGHFLALSDAGVLHLFKATPESYQEVAKAKILDGKCWSTPVISNGRVYARSTTEAVCIDLTGQSVASK